MVNVGFGRREENRRTRRKTLVAQERTNEKLYSHMAGPGMEPRTHGGERRAHYAQATRVNPCMGVI